MGADMRSGDREICTRLGCALVSGWCAPFMPDRSHVPFDEWIGVYDIPHETVDAADAATPHEPPDEPLTDIENDIWRESREFLKYAVTTGEGIQGGY